MDTAVWILVHKTTVSILARSQLIYYWVQILWVADSYFIVYEPCNVFFYAVPWIRCHVKIPGDNKGGALLNQQLREMIANDDSVKCHFSTFYLEDGSGKVVLDAMKAYKHVWHVLNDMRRIQKPSGQDDDSHKENSDDTVSL